jgi:hypothetical protein
MAMAQDPSQERRLVTVAQVVGYLENNPVAAKQFAQDPPAFLREHGFGEHDLETGHGEAALERARLVLDHADLGSDETLATALPKVSRSAAEIFGTDYTVNVEPFAVNFVEQPTLQPNFRWTATGGIRCTFDGWDGCSIGLDWLSFDRRCPELSGAWGS